MDSIPASKRRVKNIHDAESEPFVTDGVVCESESVLGAGEDLELTSSTTSN